MLTFNFFCVPQHTFVKGYFFIAKAFLNDSGIYECTAVNTAGYDVSSVEVRVTYAPPGPFQRVLITPAYFSGVVGDEIVLQCRAESPQSSVSWSRQGGELPYNARENAGVLTVTNSQIGDSGLYVCTVVSASGERGYGNATVSITQGAG